MQLLVRVGKFFKIIFLEFYLGGNLFKILEEYTPLEWNDCKKVTRKSKANREKRKKKLEIACKRYMLNWIKYNYSKKCFKKLQWICTNTIHKKKTWITWIACQRFTSITAATSGVCCSPRISLRHAWLVTPSMLASSMCWMRATTAIDIQNLMSIQIILN